MTKIDQVESVFFQVLEDIKDYLGDLTLVGGWLPFIYTRFLWNDLAVKTITTTDIDFGFGDHQIKVYPKTIFEALSSLNYTERRPKMDRLYPVVLYKAGKIPIDIITFPSVGEKSIKQFIGTQININKIEGFDFLLKHRMPINVTNKRSTHKINCPKPSAFLYHKAAIFLNRENTQKQAKDLYYIYFILRYAPDLDVILKEISLYKKQGHFKEAINNIGDYFIRKSAPGCLMVEKENGPDEYIEDVRQDIFERFNKLIGAL